MVRLEKQLALRCFRAILIFGQSKLMVLLFLDQYLLALGSCSFIFASFLCNSSIDFKKEAVVVEVKTLLPHRCSPISVFGKITVRGVSKF